LQLDQHHEMSAGGREPKRGRQHVSEMKLTRPPTSGGSAMRADRARGYRFRANDVTRPRAAVRLVAADIDYIDPPCTFFDQTSVIRRSGADIRQTWPATSMLSRSSA
jgi:hypothetical protein